MATYNLANLPRKGLTANFDYVNIHDTIIVYKYDLVNMYPTIWELTKDKLIMRAKEIKADCILSDVTIEHYHIYFTPTSKTEL